tara:strand:- start:238 stop:636 length:399 start_codon:yes stop_codon:yes gene_type:complete
MPYHSFIYVALGIIILHRLSLNIIIERRKNKVSFGDDGNRTLMRRIRAQGNFVEYTPIFLISLIGIEWIGYAKNISYYLIYVHSLGIIFILGRIFHTISLYQKKILFRKIGMRITFYSLWGNGLVLIFLVIY